MEEPLKAFKHWAHFLQQHKLDHLFSVILFSFSPMRIIIAQGLYLIQPFTSSRNISDLASILEEQDTTNKFIRYLTSEEQNE